MLRDLSLLAILACPQTCFTAAAHSALVPANNAPDGYELVWWDEFETDGLVDPARWNHDTFWNLSGWFNEEQQYYSRDRAKNARVENGHLIIEAHREQTTRKMFRDSSGQEYTSARLESRDRGFWLHGYFEIRAKMPCGAGLWPAIWTMPEYEDDWPKGGEIDIVEFYGHKPYQFEATIHTPNENHEVGNSSAKFYRTKTACTEFHTHALHWTEDEIRISVDGDEYYTRTRDSDDRDDWPFVEPHYLILNVAVRNWVGGEDGIDPDAFPARMEVDYVRVYQKSDGS